MNKALRHVPNVITGLRLMAAPATAGLMAAGHFNAAFGVFAFAGLSDAADGYLAKRFGLGSALGRILDPAADKALMLAAFLTLTLIGEIPAWVTAVVVGRDAGIVLGILTARAAGAQLVIQPLPIGKLSTALQIGYAGLHLASLAFGFDLDGFAPTDAYVLAAVTAASAFGYGVVWLKAMRAVAP